jgi:predicted GNAT family N-acyltransferase
MENLRIQWATLPQDLPKIHKIRYLVFQIEQGVDPTLEFDGNDETADHVLAYLDQKAIGTARIRYLQADTVKLERFAILPEARGLGIARQLMNFILDALSSQPITTIWMNAQVPVQAFYEKFGFVAEGNVFEEAGIPHIRMKKLLR